MVYSDGSPFGEIGRNSFYEKEEIISTLAERGDPLALGVHEYLQTLGSLDILNNCDIPKKLLHRKMTEREYFGYLNGELPITILALSGQHYLPKPQSPV